MNMLFLYRRVAASIDMIRTAIYAAMIFVAASAVGILVLLGTGCHPFNKLWQVYPDPGPYCFPDANIFLITILVLNLASDLCIILIPVPIISPLQISIERKVGLIILFGAGIFIMVAVILRAYFVDVQQMGQTAAIWPCREDVVAIVIGQATTIRPLFTPRFWGGESFLSSSATRSSAKKRSGGAVKSGEGGNSDGYELATIGARPSLRPHNFSKKNPYSITALDTMTDTEKPFSRGGNRPWKKNSESEGIRITRTVALESEVFENPDRHSAQPNPMYPATVQCQTRWNAV